jgi:hypothetical protein
VFSNVNTRELASREWLLLAVLAVCGTYFALQLVYIANLPLVMDEFQGAATVIDLLKRTPYRDYPPYKTVLGYYLQWPPILLGKLPWQALLLTRQEMAIINTIALAAAALYLRRLYHWGAVMCGLVLTVVMSDFLERSSEIRVDMLTAWAGLFSLLFLLDRRWAIAGALAGVSFLISQKGVYYCLAGGAAVGLVAVTSPRGSRIGPLIRFGGGSALTISAYMLFWIAVSSWYDVIYAVFLRPLRATGVVRGELYDIRQMFWRQTIIRNPIFYLVGFLALIQLGLGPRKDVHQERDRPLLAYGTILMALALSNNQPWPYFFVLIIPTLFVLNVSFAEWLILRYPSHNKLTLPQLASVVLLTLGVVVPIRRVPLNVARDNGFQREMVELAECVLGPTDEYIAGVDMVITRWQPVDNLRWIDAPRRDAIASLDSTALAAIVDSIQQSRVKVIIDNYRIQALPPAILSYMDREFSRFWGNLYVYGPSVPAGPRDAFVRFSGSYSVGSPGGPVTIDGTVIPPDGIAELERGSHRFSSSSGLRLKLREPACEAQADERFREPADLFPNVYSY